MKPKWTPERAKEESEKRVLSVLAFKSPQRWSELLEYGLSDPTLKKALDRLRLKGLVYKKSGGRKNVSYGLTEEGRKQIEAEDFVWRIISNRHILFSPSNRNIKNEKQLKKALKDLGRKIGAVHLFLMLKSIEKRDWSWLESVNILSFDQILFSDFIVSRTIERSPLKEFRSFSDLVKSITLDDTHLGFWGLDEKYVEKVMIVLKEVYPEEIFMLNYLLKEFENAK